MKNYTPIRLSAKKTLAGLLLLAMILLASAGTSFAITFYLSAETTTKTMPDATAITMWGFASCTDDTFTSCGAATVPGPELVVPPGDTTLTIMVKNNLTGSLIEPVSIVVPGQIATMTPVKFTDGRSRQRVRSFTQETAVGNTGTYTWTGLKAGTYLYQSGTHPALQVQMGLYGALKIDASAGNVYNEPVSAYDIDVTLLYSEIDPALHSAVAAGDYGPGMSVTSTIDYTPRYHLVNGEPYTTSAPALPAGDAGQRVLIRFLNAGLVSHVPTMVGQHMTLIAEDGNLYPYNKPQYSTHLAAGKTIDAIYTPTTSGYVPIYDRRLYLTNNTEGPGGMISFLNVASTTQYTLTVNKTGAGTGTVITTTAPGGINCGTGAGCTENYNAGTSVTLASTPDPGSYFAYWAGVVCPGRAECTVTMTSNKTVTSNFSAIQPYYLGVFNNTNSWMLDTNGSGIYEAGVDSTYTFGAAGYTAVTGDWDNDGKTEIGVYGSGTWYLDVNGDGMWNPASGDMTYRFGAAGYLPVTGDWNNDGTTDIGIYGSGTWYLDANGDHVWNPASGDKLLKFGAVGYLPVTGDWNGDGTTDIGVFLDRYWYLDLSGNGAWGAGDASYTFGSVGDKPITGDWNGDGTTEIGVYRGNVFYLDMNGNRGWDSLSIDQALTFGTAGDTPISGKW